MRTSGLGLVRRTLGAGAIALLPAAGLAACAQAPSANVGECTNSADLAEEEISEITTISCEAAHDLEVYHTFDLTGGDYPGDEAVAESADLGCYDAFEDYVGAPFEESELYYVFIHPIETSWNSAKDREVICLLHSDEPVTGSLRGSGR